MNDIEKLHHVIDALEEQSSRVNEFNGVLSAVNFAREQIESAKTQLAKLAEEQDGLISESYKRFGEFGTRLTKLESQTASLGEVQSKTLEEINAVAEQLTERVNKASADQQSAINSLRSIVVFGVLTLAGGIAFLAKDAFM